jgi:MIP family channel proteins
MRTTARHFAAEFVGTFALVFVGSGAIMMAQRTNSQAALLSVAMAHGIILAIMVSATMAVSGGHLNPVVTVAMLATRRVPALLAAVNIAAQFAGAVGAALALEALMPGETFTAVRGGSQFIALDVTTAQAVVFEAIATFFLVFVVFGTAVHPNAPRIGGLAIGLAIAADILAIGPLTGASMNPARSFGPAVATGVWEGQVVYWLGPLIGGLAAALLFEHLVLREPHSGGKRR